VICDCPTDDNGVPECETLPIAPPYPEPLPVPTVYPVDIPVTRKLQDRMRVAGWAPTAETINAERERVMLAVVAASWVTATEGGDEHVIDVGSIEHILMKEQPWRT